MKLTAKVVPYSSVVGSSVALHDEAGAVVAIVMVTVPRPSLNYKEVAGPIIEKIASVFATPASDGDAGAEPVAWREAVRAAVRRVLAEDQRPSNPHGGRFQIDHVQDDRGIQPDEYEEFALAVFAALAHPPASSPHDGVRDRGGDGDCAA